MMLYSAIHAGKYRTEDKLKNTDNTKTAHDPKQANNAKHSKKQN